MRLLSIGSDLHEEWLEWDHYVISKVIVDLAEYIPHRSIAPGPALPNHQDTAARCNNARGRFYSSGLKIERYWQDIAKIMGFSGPPDVFFPVIRMHLQRGIAGIRGEPVSWHDACRCCIDHSKYSAGRGLDYQACD